MTTATIDQILARHFGAVTRRRLERRGIRIIGITTAPDAAGSFLNPTTVYQIDDNGTGRIRTHTELRDLARSYTHTYRAAPASEPTR